jgi:vacuolar protein sorting-associated protein 13A/C
LCVFVAPGQYVLVYGGLSHKISARIRCTAFEGATDNWSELVTLFSSGTKVEDESRFHVTSPAGLKLCVLARVTGSENYDTTKMVTLYVPYWIINKTGKLLTLQQSKEECYGCEALAEQSNEPMMFSYNKGGKHKAKLRLDGSNWSDPVVLDSVGDAGVVELVGPGGAPWRVSQQVYLAEDSLTKVVTFTPHHMIYNKCVWPMEYSEVSKEEALFESGRMGVLQPEEMAPFWSTKDSFLLALRCQGSNYNPHATAISSPLEVTTVIDQKAVPGMPDSVSDVAADVRVRAERANIVVVIKPNKGFGVNRLENRSRHTLVFREAVDRPQARAKQLQPGVTRLLAKQNWASTHIEVSVEGSTTAPLLVSDAFLGTVQYKFIIGGAPNTIHIATFPDGSEYLLVSFDSAGAAQAALEAAGLDKPHETTPDYEHVSLYCTISIHRVGLSLVSDKPNDIFYLSVLGQSVWEWRLLEPDHWGDEWRRLSVDSQKKLEVALAQYKTKAGSSPEIRIEDDMIVNLDTMEVRSKKKGAHLALCDVRQMAAPGIHIEYIDAARYRGVKLQVELLQLDDQSGDTLCPIMLQPAKPAHSHIPLLPLIKFQQIFSKPSVTTTADKLVVHRMALLLQPFEVSLTDMVLLQLKDFATFSKDNSVNVGRELAAVKTDPFAYLTTMAFADTRGLYKQLELHPLSVTFSFLLMGELMDTMGQSNPVRGLINALGVTIGRIDSVPFRLNALIIKDAFSSKDELTSMITNHYVKQALREAYKIFGCLDFLGNPVKFFLHLGTGIFDFYYESFLDGVESMARNTLAGTTGTVTSITGTLGNTFATLSMDKDYSRSRRADNMRKKTAIGHLRYGGERLGKSLLEGIGGVCMQPWEGAKREGGIGFIKGVGKGFLGVVAKPVGGVLDLTTSALESVRASLEVADQRKRVRAPRLVRPDKVIRPYSKYEADGVDMFRSLSIKHLAGENYFIHFFLHDTSKKSSDKSARLIYFFTDKSIYCVKPGSHDQVWHVQLANIHGRQLIEGKGIELTYTRPKMPKKKWIVMLPTS